MRARLTRENECVYFDAVPKEPPPLPEGRLMVTPVAFSTGLRVGGGGEGGEALQGGGGGGRAAPAGGLGEGELAGGEGSDGQEENAGGQPAAV